MAAKDLQKKTRPPQKRKENPGSNTHSGNSISKRPKLAGTKPSSKPPSKDSKNKPFKQFKSNHGDDDKKAPMSKSERRKHAKELAEARKSKRKHNYALEHELARLSEKIRVRQKDEEQGSKFEEERSKLVSEAIQKMKGKIPEIASSHVTSRVLQCCVEHCSQAERDTVFEELQPHLPSLSARKYAVFLIKKVLKHASKNQLAKAISTFHGHVVPLLRHKEGSVVIEHLYQLGNTAQKQALLVELYSAELQKFKDLGSMKESKLVDIISKLSLTKSSVIRHMTSVIQPILEKEIVEHSIIHRALIEYLSIADKSSATYVIQQLSSALLVKMIKTKDGSRIGMLCVKLGSAKERKKIIKGMKDSIQEIAEDQYGSMVLVCILSVVDDTKLVTKVVIDGIKEIITAIVLNKNGRRLFLQLLRPNCPRYFNPSYLASLDLSVPSLSSKDEGSNEDGKPDKVEDGTESGANRSSEPGESHNIVEGGKKDPFVRRQELLVKSGLAENLLDVCIENAGKLLRSDVGKDVIYEVVTGGADGILNASFEDKSNALHNAIASLAAEPKSDDSKEEHVLENFHSSRTLRKLILDCPAFATTLWNKALKGNCEMWATGHSGKVLTAYLVSSDSKVRNLADKKLQGLIDRGLLKIPEKQQSTVATEV